MTRIEGGSGMEPPLAHEHIPFFYNWLQSVTLTLKASKYQVTCTKMNHNWKMIELTASARSKAHNANIVWIVIIKFFPFMIPGFLGLAEGSLAIILFVFPPQGSTNALIKHAFIVELSLVVAHRDWVCPQ